MAEAPLRLFMRTAPPLGYRSNKSRGSASVGWRHHCRLRGVRERSDCIDWMGWDCIDCIGLDCIALDWTAEANHDFAEWITSIEADARVDGQRLGSLLQVRCSSVNKEWQYGP